MARPPRNPNDPTAGKKTAVFPVRLTEEVELDVYRRAARMGLAPCAYLRKLVHEGMYGLSFVPEGDDYKSSSDFAPLGGS